MDYQEAIKAIAAGAKDLPEIGFRNSFLIGAGASVSSHIPDGETISQELQREYKFGQEEIEKNRIEGMTNYQAVMNYAKEIEGEKFISKFIRNMILINAKRPKPDNRWIINNCYNVLANILVERKDISRAVFTTNFDPLLYYAFIQNWNTEPILIRHSDEMTTMVPRQVLNEFPCLIYLHGYWQNHYQYHDIEQLDHYIELWADRLTQWLENDLIVIGYSGLEDSIAMQWIGQCLENGRNVWWCIYNPNGEKLIEKENEITNKLGADGTNLHFISIKNADQFALDLGVELGMQQAIDVHRANQVLPWFYPNDISEFANGSDLKFDTSEGFAFALSMGKDENSSNNHAGINFGTTEHEIDISKNNKFVIDYKVVSNKTTLKKAVFEYKLHGKKSAYSYYVPLGDKGNQIHEIPLQIFRDNNVDLKTIWAVVLAADVNCLGVNGKAEILINKIELI